MKWWGVDLARRVERLEALVALHEAEHLMRLLAELRAIRSLLLRRGPGA